MNLTKIDWADCSWTPVIGCSKGCEFCYARRMNHRFKWIPDFHWPQFFPDKLNEPSRRKKPSWIFVCSTGELFDPRGSFRWIYRIMEAITAAPQHQFVILTKQPSRVLRYLQNAEDFNEVIPTNLLIGISVVRDNDFVPARLLLVKLHEYRIDSVLCAEPMLEGLPSFVQGFRGKHMPLGWLIVGLNTAPGAREFPSQDETKKLIVAAHENQIPVFVKRNAFRLVEAQLRFREWPSRHRKR